MNIYIYKKNNNNQNSFKILAAHFGFDCVQTSC